MFYKYFFDAIVDMFSPNRKNLAEEYFSTSANRYDLENRMREVERGKAPFQQKYPWPL